MTGPGADRITLDRTNLRRLADALAEGVEKALSEAAVTDYQRGFTDGHRSAVLALRKAADLMPDLYGDEGCLVVTDPSP